MPPRPAPDTPFTEEDLARLPQWAQRKVTWLSGQLARALELAGQADRDTPTESATERADADSLANAGRRALAKARITDGRTEAEYLRGVYWNAFGDPDRAQAPASEKSLNAWGAALSVALARYAALPVGLTVSDEGDVLNWEGINYCRQDALARYAALPVGLTVSDEGDVLNWEGINYCRQDALTRVLPDTAAQAGVLEAEGLFLAVSTLARIASLANEGLDALPGAEGVGDDD